MKAIEALKEFLANETDDYCYEFGFNNEETLKVEILGQTHTLSAALVDAGRQGLPAHQQPHRSPDNQILITLKNRKQ